MAIMYAAVALGGHIRVGMEDNIIFGGSQKGVSLGTVGSRPNYDDNTEAISAIRTNAGTTWK